MIITPLGHTEFLVDIANSDGENIRILVDSWLSDFVIGDMMERSPKVELDSALLPSIDAIYISHAHSDHLDPYTLMEIYRYANPVLILPVILRYLEPLFIEFIPKALIRWLTPRKSIDLRGIEITGYMFQQPDITNEDDVMMLGISSERELLFAEIDTIPDEYDETVQSELFRIFDRKEYQTRCYLASRNELEGQIQLYDLDERRRKSFRAEYIAGRKDEMRATYEKFEYEEYTDFPNIFTLPGFVKGYIGQGMMYPQALSGPLSELNIFPLEEIASMESDIARGFGYEFAQKALLPWRQYRIENGTIEAGRKECPIGKIQKNPEALSKNPKTERIYSDGPLFDRDFDGASLENMKIDIQNLLNHRFLPYWSASSVASLRSALIENPDGAYRIEFKIVGQDSVLFEYSFSSLCFTEIAYASDTRIDENYWLSDILDFLEGRQELYSNFWHRLDPKKTYRLWTCLGANFCNNDLVFKKYRLHFERARGQLTVNSFVESIILGFGK